MSGDEDYIPEDEAEETVLERVLALSEMFPESVRNGVDKSLSLATKGIKKAYAVGRIGTWWFFSSAIILVAPVLFEIERFQMDEMQKMQQRQMLLGPNVARS